MKFRPCIDIHNGRVKQIVGGSLTDQRDQAEDNYVAKEDAAFFAGKYQQDGRKGGHIILLNPVGSKWYAEDLAQAEAALKTAPGLMQLGGGVTLENAEYFLKMGASHVIVTSYVFRNGCIDYARLEKLSASIGREHLVLDLSCRSFSDGYYIMTDRWQNKTKERVLPELLDQLYRYCDEFLIHAVDVEGKRAGIEKKLIRLLGGWSGCPVTYAGGIHTLEDLEYIREWGNGRIDFTVGSALDLFGGDLSYQELLKKY